MFMKDLIKGALITAFVLLLLANVFVLYKNWDLRASVIAIDIKTQQNTNIINAVGKLLQEKGIIEVQ